MSEERPRSPKFERGLATRRKVLGDEYVERSLRQADEFSWPLQQLTTEWCWDEIWNRPGLDKRSRSLLNLGMLSALNRPHELKVHIRGAINNGLSQEEIKEAFLQVAIYCGMPAAMESFRIARETFKEIGLE
ncbi:MAG TPA: carboxymuconolactone decarboxylase family protein [Roseiarcus sp.]|nr:carboxymuconolactone decarboxylase family protein [Roseiarcus sp.]